MARCMVGAQCCGVTRYGRRCSIASMPIMVDPISGKLVSEPLKRGGRCCLFHTVFFCTREVAVSGAIAVFLDLETSGLSVLTDHIVEIGVVDEYGATFSTVVRPPIMPAGPAVHGIAVQVHVLERATQFGCAQNAWWQVACGAQCTLGANDKRAGRRFGARGADRI